ncbi:CIC11C00000003383 [Sungouiella intermedia]|uniref:CIC11C00000003383 n=1 Tax=Sungouiella intermedia TaxID=45354 RepID=A0A1L0D6A4_9ASCO|nr:CIC11C00000003383 [[Candida] intermedia]
MCKRSVARFNGSDKRPKKETLTYTQGPLDEKFGQHAAFPLDAAVQGTCKQDSSVFDYLASVRKEAEADAAVHFVSRDPEELTQPEASKSTKLSPEYVKMVMTRLEEAKLANKNEIQVGEIELDCSEIEGDIEDDADLDVHDLNVNVDVEVEEPDDLEPQMEVPQSAAAWRSLVFSQSPPPTSFFNTRLEHTTIIKLIVYYTKWLLVSMPATLMEWIFVTFVRLDNGLDHTEMSLVRDLGRKARKLRTKFLEGKSEGLSIPAVAEETVDMILAVVGVYYGQRDLLIDAE